MFTHKYEILEGNIPFDKLIIKRFKPRKLDKDYRQEVKALDTETLKGYCKLLADSDGNYLLDGDIYTYLDYLSSLKFENKLNFFFNLNYDANALIKHMDRENIMDLRRINKTSIGKYNIFYIPKKVLSITKGHHTNKFFDVAQFFKGSLENVAKRYLNLEKYQDNYDKIDGKILGNSLEYWENNLDTIIDYCLNDCKLTKQLGELLINTVFKSIKMYPNKYYSEASISEFHMRKTIDIPNILNIDIQALRYAHNTYCGGRFEIIEKGNIGKCSLYDITSAYPNYMRELIDVNKGKWIKVNSMNENADLGYYLVKVLTKYNSKLSPLNYYLNNNMLIYPHIECYKYMTLKELLAYEKFIDFEIINGWEFHANEYIYPFKDFIDLCYGEKMRSDCYYYYNDDCREKCLECKTFLSCEEMGLERGFEYSFWKIDMNGGYGKFYQKIKKPDGKYYAGKLYNPIYATEITSQTQIQIYEFAQKDLPNFVGFATDSVVFKGKPDITVPKNKELGKWNLEKEGLGLVLKSGMYQIDKDIKTRGMNRKHQLKTPFGEFKNIFDYIENQPSLLAYPVLLENPLSFKKVIQCCKKYSIEDINLFIPEKYNIDLNSDKKRTWERYDLTGNDILNNSYTSKPLMLYA